MKKQILLYLFLFFCCNSYDCDYISNYYQTVYEAEIYYLKNENRKALELLKKAESQCGLLNQVGTYEPVIMAELLVRTKQEDKAFPYLYRTLEDGLTFEVLNSNPEFDILKSKAEWKNLEKKAPKIEAKFQKSINKTLRNEIIKMTLADQKVRKGDIDFEELIIVDSINEKRMKEIFIEYGYPHYKLVGHSKSLSEDTDIGAMLMHFKDTIFFKERLLEYIQKGQASPYELASMIDSQQRSVGMFTYGVYRNINSNKIRNFKNIDQTRTEIGLRPYEMEKEYWELLMVKFNFNK